MEKAVIVLSLMSGANCLDYAKHQGFKTILLGTKICLEDSLNSELPLEIDLNNEELVLKEIDEIAKKFNIQGVFTLNEYRVPLAARIANYLGLVTGVPYEAAFNCRHKDITRRMLCNADISPIKYEIIKSINETLSACQKVGFPLVVKPSNDAGSRNVTKCNTLEDAWEAVKLILDKGHNWVGQNFSGHVLIEEYLDGPEYSVESFTINHKTQVIAVTEKKVDERTCVELQHILPAPLSHEVLSNINILVVKALDVLGVNNAVTHVEIKNTSKGPRIIEINCRPGGDNISSLCDLSYGVDLRHLAFDIAVGLTNKYENFSLKARSVSGIRFFEANSTGRLDIDTQALTSLQSFDSRIEFYKQKNDFVERTSSNYNRLGFYITNQCSYEEVVEAMSKAQASLNITIL